ncbi:amidase family protein [Caulobacter segnis]
MGLKPSKGRWSTRGLVPACRSLDCISVFAADLAGAALVDQVLAAFDPEARLFPPRSADGPRPVDGRPTLRDPPARSADLLRRRRVRGALRRSCRAPASSRRRPRRGRHRPAAGGGQAALQRSLGRRAHGRRRAPAARDAQRHRADRGGLSSRAAWRPRASRRSAGSTPWKATAAPPRRSGTSPTSSSYPRRRPSTG